MFCLCYFGKLPSQVKSKLLCAYSSSLYGCELWDLWNSNIANVCVCVSVAWRKASRRACNLPLSYFLFGYLIHYFMMQSVNMCCILFQSFLKIFFLYTCARLS